jgi:subtilisin family serine protease
VVSMSIDTARGLRREAENFRLCPIRRYRPALRPFVSPRSRGLYASTPDPLTVALRVLNEKREPLENATIAVVTDLESMTGFRRKTHSTGRVRLKFPGAVARADQVYVYAPVGYFGRFESNVQFSATNEIILQKVEPGAFPSPLADCGGARSISKGSNVTVGVLDTGIYAKHPALKLAGGLNATDDGQGAAAFQDIQEHGTHVAGIIAANGSGGMLGVAPKVNLRYLSSV